MTDPTPITRPGDEPVDQSAVDRVRAVMDTTSVEGTDTEVATPPATALEQPGGEPGTGEYLIRSEEHLQVGTETVATGRVWLQKFVVTREQTITVSVSHEEVRVVREPIAQGVVPEPVPAGDRATEVILTEERIVVTKQVVPVERVRLETQTITEQREVTQTVRKEQIEVHDDSTGRTHSLTDEPAAADPTPPTPGD